MTLSRAELARYLETTILNPDATRQEIVQLCEDALKYNFVVVCCHPAWVPLAHSILQGSPVRLMTPVGFPFGANTTACKVFEAQDAIRNGVDEIDTMMFLGAFKDRDYRAVQEDIAAVIQVAGGRTVKVIIETALLSQEEKVTACEIAVAAGAHFVKTSSGNALPGATVEDIRLMRRTVGPDFGVKASGGITDLDTVLAFIAAGADRIATRVAVDILHALPE